jgi:hypothetical protein
MTRGVLFIVEFPGGREFSFFSLKDRLPEKEELLFNFCRIRLREGVFFNELSLDL